MPVFLPLPPEGLKRQPLYKRMLRKLCRQHGIEYGKRSPASHFMLADLLAQNHTLLHYLLEYEATQPNARSAVEAKCSLLRKAIERTVVQLDKIAKPTDAAQTPQTADAYQRAAAKHTEAP